MTTITLELPPDLDLSEHDAKVMFVGKLYEEGILTSVQAAEVVGITKREFIETIGKYGVSVFQATPEEAERDHRRNAERRRVKTAGEATCVKS